MKYSIKHINQDEKSNTCGQTTLAMLLNKTTEEVCVLMGKTGKTKTKDLVSILEKEGFKVKNKKLRRVSKKNKIPSFAILHLRPLKKIKGYWGHWSLSHEGIVYDPAFNVSASLSIESYIEMISKNGIKISSFIGIEQEREA